MPALHPINRKELIRKLKALEFRGPYSSGTHQYLERGNEKIFIPNPHGKDIGTPLLKQIIKQLKISKDKFPQL